jgi:hypothetical protein
MPITSDGLIVPKGPARKAGSPILVPKRPPTQTVRIGDKTVTTSLVRAAPVPRAPIRMPNVVRPKAYGHTVARPYGDATPMSAAERALQKCVAEVVLRHYPGHAWAIDVPPGQGVVNISIPLFMGYINKWNIPVSMLKSDPGMRLVVRACGEILERYKIPRGGFLPDRFVEVVEKIPAWKRARTGWIPS